MPPSEALAPRGCLGRGLLVLFLVLLAAGSPVAQTTYPTRTVRIVLGFGPGTAPDVTLRVVADALSRKWGKPVVIENAVGASGNIAGERVARAPPDGHTLLFASSSGIVIGPRLLKKMSYDPIKELSPISILYSHPNVLAVHKGVAVTSVQGLVELARTKPGVLNAASAGLGTTQHLSAEIFRKTARIDFVHVPYLGGTNLMRDLISGRFDFVFGVPTNVLAQVSDGGLRALAVTSPKRFSGAPQLPTMAESGFPDFNVTVWWGLFAPAGTPATMIEAVHEATAQIVALPHVRKRLEQMNVEPVCNSPAEFSAVIAAESPMWTKLIREVGISHD